MAKRSDSQEITCPYCGQVFSYKEEQTGQTYSPGFGPFGLVPGYMPKPVGPGAGPFGPGFGYNPGSGPGSGQGPGYGPDYGPGYYPGYGQEYRPRSIIEALYGLFQSFGRQWGP